MPQPIMTKYKQGDLGMPYPKKKDNMKNINMSSHNGGEADGSVATKDYPKEKKTIVQPSVFAMADKKDY